MRPLLQWHLARWGIRWTLNFYNDLPAPRPPPPYTFCYGPITLWTVDSVPLSLFREYKEPRWVTLEEQCSFGVFYHCCHPFTEHFPVDKHYVKCLIFTSKLPRQYHFLHFKMAEMRLREVKQISQGPTANIVTEPHCKSTSNSQVPALGCYLQYV